MNTSAHCSAEGRPSSKSQVYCKSPWKSLITTYFHTEVQPPPAAHLTGFAGKRAKFRLTNWLRAVAESEWVGESKQGWKCDKINVNSLHVSLFTYIYSWLCTVMYMNKQTLMFSNEVLLENCAPWPTNIVEQSSPVVVFVLNNFRDEAPRFSSFVHSAIRVSNPHDDVRGLGAAKRDKITISDKAETWHRVLPRRSAVSRCENPTSMNDWTATNVRWTPSSSDQEHLNAQECMTSFVYIVTYS